MAKTNKIPEGQMPLVAQVNQAGHIPAVVVAAPATKAPAIQEDPIEFNSPKELNHFSQAMQSVVPDDLKASPEIGASITNLFNAYYRVVDSTKSLALAVYEFCELTKVPYADVSAAIAKGIQKQLSKGYVSKLFYAGRGLKYNPVLNRLTDIE
jgi:hypothetical protein